MKVTQLVTLWSHAKNGRAIMELKINLFDEMVPSSPNWFDAHLICSHLGFLYRCNFHKYLINMFSLHYFTLSYLNMHNTNHLLLLLQLNYLHPSNTFSPPFSATITPKKNKKIFKEKIKT